MVGVSTSDDAAVYRLSADTALVQTVDFFPPVVDDPYDYGAISAANSLSDVYATGARPITALNIVAFPDDLPRSILQEVLRGGAEKAAEANVPIVGGHTIKDAEPKYGLAVTGLAHPDHILTNAGARTGDALVLTKPIGSGVITTAAKLDRAGPAVVASAVSHMSSLNKGASEAALEVGVHACVDVTGFGLLGHLRKMAEESGVGARISIAAIPLMEGAVELSIGEGIAPGGTGQNRSYHEEWVELAHGAAEGMLNLLYDPQTSGGLLLSVEAAKTDALLDALHRRGVRHAAVIGETSGGRPGAIVVDP